MRTRSGECRTRCGRMIMVALLLVLLSLPAGLAAAQSCQDAIRATAPGANFSLRSDGTARDNTTGLIWMRCSLGQTWDGKTCSGEAATFAWAAALPAAQRHAFAGYSDWRIPNKNELESIVEERCISPAINVTTFPATPLGYFWTASPYAGLAHAAWSIDFGYGSVNASVKSGSIYLRLVRDDP